MVTLSALNPHLQLEKKKNQMKLGHESTGYIDPDPESTILFLGLLP